MERRPADEVGSIIKEAEGLLAKIQAEAITKSLNEIHGQEKKLHSKVSNICRQIKRLKEEISTLDELYNQMQANQDASPEKFKETKQKYDNQILPYLEFISKDRQETAGMMKLLTLLQGEKSAITNHKEALKELYTLRLQTKEELSQLVKTKLTLLDTFFQKSPDALKEEFIDTIRKELESFPASFVDQMNKYELGKSNEFVVGMKYLTEIHGFQKKDFESVSLHDKIDFSKNKLSSIVDSFKQLNEKASRENEAPNKSLPKKLVTVQKNMASETDKIKRLESLNTLVKREKNFVEHIRDGLFS